MEVMWDFFGGYFFKWCVILEHFFIIWINIILIKSFIQIKIIIWIETIVNPLFLLEKLKIWNIVAQLKS